jgi:hypothetical protein
MTITLKPLTAVVTRVENTAIIEIKNEQGVVALTEKHYEIHTSANPAENINDKLAQMKNSGLNIVAVETVMPGVELR